MLHTDCVRYSRTTSAHCESWELTERIDVFDADAAADHIEQLHRSEGLDCEVSATFSGDTDGDSDIEVTASTFGGITSVDIFYFDKER